MTSQKYPVHSGTGHTVQSRLGRIINLNLGPKKWNSLSETFNEAHSKEIFKLFISKEVSSKSKFKSKSGAETVIFIFIFIFIARLTCHLSL